jgi:uncharacterized radical SAM superfamily Fe-S cluster-containing enzyme
LVYLHFNSSVSKSDGCPSTWEPSGVSRRAIDNLFQAGIDVVLVVTVERGVNDNQVGDIVQFAIENAEKVTVVAFQPISFSGRKESVDDEQRRASRYTLSHLAHDLKAQLGVTEPVRDWYPLSAMNPFSDFMDQIQGPNAGFGSLNCGCHPDCGVGTILLVNKVTKQMVPLTQLLNVDQLLHDVQLIADCDSPKPDATVALALSILRNFRAPMAPDSYHMPQLVRQIASQIGARGGRIGASEGDAEQFPWRFLFVAGMWFQDLWNYDFRRTEMCIIPYGTQLGEISFCAYNTGVGWRQIVEKLYRTAPVSESEPHLMPHEWQCPSQTQPVDAAPPRVLPCEFGDKKRHLRLVG